MLHVKTPDEALEIIRSAFVPLDRPPEAVPLSAALGRRVFCPSYRALNEYLRRTALERA